MSTASLHLPVGARTGPTSRSVAEAWAAPRAADLVLDPWAAPIGPPIAQLLLSPWPAPDPAMRIVTMPPPVALAPVPDLTLQATSMAESTDAALAAITAATVRAQAPTAAPVGETAAAPAVVATQSGASTARLRAKLWALVAGSAAAAAGAVTLLATAL